VIVGVAVIVGVKVASGVKVKVGVLVSVGGGGVSVSAASEGRPQASNVKTINREARCSFFI
jgi:hypothetical protein